MSRRTWLIHLLLVLSCVIVTAPIVFAMVKATQTRAQVLSPSLVPGTELVNNVRAAWTTGNLGVYMRNSLVVAFAVTFGKTLLSLMAATALVYFQFPFKRFFFGFILLTLLTPLEVLVLPLFDLVSQPPPASWEALWAWLRDPRAVLLEPGPFGFGWANTYFAIIVPFLASATGVFLFHQHFRSIPRSLADAAKIDGAGPLRFLANVLVPMSWNTIGALAVIQFVYVWDQYLWPRIIIRREETQVVQVGLSFILNASDRTEWGQVMAAALITILPPLVVFGLLQEQFMRGFALSSDK
ncbi:carbohydrate ABC transporter permease [Truepera radiovictrix]|uniref:Binding-protein-dependent transport systems inner membrane component n=1 Tax=Truepera radiovictrix (strain DSM 17093 / CIP 108686 / LMG 22925 / RQ-24) TaxID=649638 RepID=D7CSV5_TRURR|nr:carbohydrate ABC transporter permease [Truepera radiovictrix]ADI13722.1 binding-protein-dependent transport systems inner membrane component [Truepera radiovictrix DSM 17093]WMT57713.1 carbohydrate ABC transporter permease [Truepera radiovictrix]